LKHHGGVILFERFGSGLLLLTLNSANFFPLFRVIFRIWFYCAGWKVVLGRQFSATCNKVFFVNDIRVKSGVIVIHVLIKAFWVHRVLVSVFVAKHKRGLVLKERIFRPVWVNV
jgi:hypothetical protein